MTKPKATKGRLPDWLQDRKPPPPRQPFKRKEHPCPSCGRVVFSAIYQRETRTWGCSGCVDLKLAPLTEPTRCPAGWKPDLPPHLLPVRERAR